MTAPETFGSARTWGLAAVVVALFGSAFYFRDRFETSDASKIALSNPVERSSSIAPATAARRPSDPVAASSPTPPTPTAPAPTAAKPEPVTGEPAASVASPPAPAKTEVAPAPQFDVVRVEPSGEALLAGRGAPDGNVALVAGGKVIAETKADAAGNFVMTPPALGPGDYALSLRQGEGAAIRESAQSVTVVVPKTRQQQVVVALAEPGKATKLLSDPPAPAPASAPKVEPVAKAAADGPPAAPKLAIRSVELENGSGLFASGAAAPGSDIRLYLNDSHVADVIAAAAGTWSVTVRRGLAAGHYAVRADSVAADRAVTARVEVPFDVPAAMEQPARQAKVAPLPVPRPSALDTVASRPETAAKLAVTSSAGEAPASSAAPATAPSASPHAVAAATQAEPPQRIASSEPPPAAQPAASAEPAADRLAAQASQSNPAPTTATANAVIDDLQTQVVTHGDNLWRISRKRLGHGTRYTQIYAANLSQIRDPKLIYPGQVFVMPQN